MSDDQLTIDPPSPRPRYWVPTPEEIREGCLQIQAGWSAREERVRRVNRDSLGWEVPDVRKAPS